MSRESELAGIGASLLTQLCVNVEREYQIEQGYRVDLKGELPNGQLALVEVKGFGDNLTPLIDAVFQAKSYADAIRHPVFIGPIAGSPSEIAHGSLTNALGAIHLMAGRMNVGFLLQTHRGDAKLLLRGQVLVDSSGPATQFDKHWGYIEQLGSRRARTN